MPQVVVTIDGKTYRMACADGEEDHLRALAERFDKTLVQLRGAFGEIGDQRLTVMTGISVMDQLVDAEAKLEASREDLAEFSRVKDEATDKVDRAEGDLTRKVEDITARIERIAGLLARTPNPDQSD